MTKTFVLAATLVLAAPIAAFACSGAKMTTSSAEQSQSYSTAQLPTSTKTEVK